MAAKKFWKSSKKEEKNGWSPNFQIAISRKLRLRLKRSEIWDQGVLNLDVNMILGEVLKKKSKWPPTF